MAEKRFSDQRYLDEYVARKAYPGIHDAAFNLYAEEVEGKRALDLCCGTGLLGERIREGLRHHVVGVDADADAIHRGRTAGIRELYQLQLSRQTLPRLAELVVRERLTVVVARRCIPELFTDNAWGMELSVVLQAAGIREWVLQGRAKSSAATHPINSVERELDALGFVANVRKGACAYVKTED